ncbi:MAG: type IV pilus secretin PilQ [Alcanivoracaceae bacterium]|jgi:type IV pilus assembly protein PilQ|nr:type IV pilus secretin PilQ [Alcanivoracaceae bacterium]
MGINIVTKTKASAARQFASALVLLLLGCSALASASTITNMTYSTLPGNQLEVRLTFDGEVPDVKGYSIEQPARIALDVMGASSALKSKRHPLGTGNVRELTVIEAKDRTRLIFNLAQSLGYKTEKEDNQLVVTLGVERSKQAENVAVAAGADAQNIREVDFRRGAQGEGQVVIRLSDPAIPVDVREEGGRVIARFVGAELPKELHRRLDVTDFATPVKFVDAKFDGQNTIITIEPNGTWEYLAYQADNNFTINVKELSQAEVAKRKKDAFQYTGEKLSLSFQDIEVRSVLQLIADFTGLNLVASDTVEGKITLRLQNVPWDQALDLILKTKGLDKRKVGNVLLVAPADEIAAREQLELESQKKVEALAPLRTEYMRINYAKAADLATIIRDEGSLLSGRGSITLDERTNTLIIQDTEKKLEEIKEVVQILDVQVQQVLIEARVVIATTDVANEVGVRWGGIGFDNRRLTDDRKGFILGGRANQVAQVGYEGYLSGDDIEYTSERYAVDLGVDDVEASRFALGFLSLDSGMLELELSALDSEGRADLVATPKVLTADKSPAVIASGQQFGYQVATSSGATSIEFKEAELRLEVTPSITPEGKVIMEVKVNNDSLSGEEEAGIPLIDTNRLETTVLVGDGETLVLGGIFQQATTNLTIKTPFLADLPWIGNLFRKRAKSDDKRELLIFVTPRLVKDVVASK